MLSARKPWRQFSSLLHLPLVSQTPLAQYSYRGWASVDHQRHIQPLTTDRHLIGIHYGACRPTTSLGIHLQLHHKLKLILQEEETITEDLTIIEEEEDVTTLPEIINLRRTSIKIEWRLTMSLREIASREMKRMTE